MVDASKEVPCSGTGVEIPDREHDKDGMALLIGFDLGFHAK